MRVPFAFVVLVAACALPLRAQSAPKGADAAPSEGFAQEAGAWLERARELAAAGDQAGAHVAVDSALALDPGHYGARLMRARLLSWQGRHDAADILLEELLRERLDDAEAMLARAYLRYYEGRLAEAEAEFEALLRASPGDGDAAAGLARARAARRAQSSAPPRWRVDAGLEYSDFSRIPQAAWHQQFAQVARHLEDGTTVHLRLENHRRFGMDDFMVEAGVARALLPRLFGAAAAGWTFAPDFRPEWRLAADVEFLASPARTSGGVSAWLLGTARYDAYAETEVLGLLPGVRLERGEWAGTARLAHSIGFGGVAAENGVLTGWSARVDGPVYARGATAMRFFAGLADAPETVARGPLVTTVSTATLFGGLILELRRGWQVSLACARDDREDSYIRYGYSLSVARKY